MILEYHLHQQHVEQCAQKNGEQGIMLPLVQSCGGGKGKDLGESESSGAQVDVFQTIDDQHAHDRIRKNVAQIEQDFGGLPAEDQEGAGADQDSDGAAYQNDTE